jgi:hypothetical protein
MKPRPELVREALEAPEIRQIREEWHAWASTVQSALEWDDVEDKPVPWGQVDVTATVEALPARARAVAELILSQPTAEAAREEFLRHDRSWSKGLIELLDVYCEAAAGEEGR